jgi:hypothetical protein
MQNKLALLPIVAVHLLFKVDPELERQLFWLKQHLHASRMDKTPIQFCC